MNVDESIAEAVSKVVADAQQPSTVRDQILIWYDQVLSGNESLAAGPIANKNVAYEHLDRIFEQMWTPPLGDEGE